MSERSILQKINPDDDGIHCAECRWVEMFGAANGCVMFQGLRGDGQRMPDCLTGENNAISAVVRTLEEARAAVAAASTSGMAIYAIDRLIQQGKK